MVVTSVASRVAEEMGCEIGQTVGFSVPFDDKTRPSITRIKYMTDEILFKEIMSDPLLLKYSVVMIDGVQERSLYTEILLGLLKKILAKRNDLRLVLCTAAVDAQRYVEYFSPSVAIRSRTTVSGPVLPPTKGSLSKDPAMISFEGDLFPVEALYLNEPCSDPVKMAVQAVLRINKEEILGGILVFLPGRKEIEQALQLMSEGLIDYDGPRIYAQSLHASMPQADQMAAPLGHRKVVFATNIAEHSITIEDVAYVVDTGLVKLKVYDPKADICKLIDCQVSKSSARQRAKRACLRQPGKVYRLYTRDQFESFSEFPPSSLELEDLTGAILQLKAIGIDDVLGFGFIDQPSESSVQSGYQKLHALGAVDDDGNLTKDIGEILAVLPISPQLGRMLVKSKEHGCTNEILTVVSMASVGDIFFSDVPDELRYKQGVLEGDHLSLLNMFNAYIENKANAVKWAPRHGLNVTQLQKAELLRSRLANQLRALGIDASQSTSGPILIRKCISSGLFMNLAQSNNDGSYRLLKDIPSSRKALYIHPESMLFKTTPEWIVFEEAVQTTKSFMRNVTVVKKEWAAEVAPHYFKLTYR